MAVTLSYIESLNVAVLLRVVDTKGAEGLTLLRHRSGWPNQVG